MKIDITLTTTPKARPDQNNLGFGNYFTDHMFIMNYSDGKGWYTPRIVPYAPLSLDPASMVFHYGQEVFEGLKAYRSDEGKVLLFRPDKNMARLNVSNERLCIPQIDEKFAIEAIKTLVNTDKSWIPTAPETSLYIRPFIIAVDPFVGVRASNEYLFIIILSPVGAYYKEGLSPIKIYVENEYVRAVRGGLGHTKAGANYAASLAAQNKAKKMNYSQVMWLDGIEQKYIEEVGTTNVFFKINGTYVTPALGGSILSGVTRMSVIELLKSWGCKVEERKLSIDELVAANENGTFEEAFATGTAAVVSPIGELRYGEKILNINNGKIGENTQKIYNELTSIQWGKKKGPDGWSVEI